MARGHKTYRPGGIVTAISPALVPAEKAIDIKNVCYRPDGSFGPRTGFRARLEAANMEALGEAVVNNTRVPFVIHDGVMSSITTVDLTIAYANPPGTGDTITISSSGTVITLSVYLAGALLGSTTLDLLTGFEAAPVTLTNLKTFLETTAGVTATIPAAVAGLPAAFSLGWIEMTVLAGAAQTVPYRYLTRRSFMSGDTGTTTSFYNSYTQNSNLITWGRSPRIRPNWAKVDKSVYFTNGLTINKWDGSNVFPLGVATPTVATASAAGGGGSIAAGTYNYIITFSVVDAFGVEIESEAYTVLGPTGGPAVAVAAGNTVTVTGIQGQTGWRPGGGPYVLWGAVVNGAQGGGGGGAGVNTIVCDDGGVPGAVPPYLDIGDTVYFYDLRSASFVTRLVTNKTATSITIDGNPVSVADNIPIAPNIKINLYRTKVGPSTLFYRVGSFPINITAATQTIQYRDDGAITYSDGLADTSLGAVYTFPVVSHRAFPHAVQNPNIFFTIQAICAHDGLLVVGGSSSFPNRVYFSDVDATGYFPPENAFDITFRGEHITGLFSLDESLLVFTENSLWAVTGDLVQASFTVRQISAVAGSSSQANIVNIEGGLYFANKRGVWVYRPGSGIEGITGDIQNLFTERLCPITLNSAPVSALELRSSTAYFDPYYQAYVLQAQLATSPTYSDYVTLVYDLRNGSGWYVWRGMNMYAGAAKQDLASNYNPTGLREYFWGAAPWTAANTTSGFAVMEMDGNLDHSIAMETLYQSGFESLGDPLQTKHLNSVIVNRTKRELSFSLAGTLALYKNGNSQTAFSYKTISAITTTGVAETLTKVGPKKVESLSYKLSGAGDGPAWDYVGVEFDTPYRIGVKDPNG